MIRITNRLCRFVLILVLGSSLIIILIGTVVFLNASVGTNQAVSTFTKQPSVFPLTLVPSLPSFNLSDIPQEPLPPNISNQNLSNVLLTPIPTETISYFNSGLITTSLAISNHVGTIRSVIGYSTEGRAIEAFRFGNGPNHVMLVGGIHGGYEWNTILLGYKFIDFFIAYPEEVPSTMTITIIPSANPDGQFLVTGRTGRFVSEDVMEPTEQGRFNGNKVDLNRNWDCQWQPTGIWREQVVSAGEYPFSEVETQQLRDFITSQVPALSLVVFLHSAASGIFMGGCDQNILPQTFVLTQVYSDASGYSVYESFVSYSVTGDASDYLATLGIPSFSIELKNHSDLDWDENLSGVRAILTYFHELGSSNLP